MNEEKKETRLVRNTKFYLTYCFPSVFAVCFIGYLDHGSVAGLVTSFVLTTAIVGGLLTMFRR